MFRWVAAVGIAAVLVGGGWLARQWVPDAATGRVVRHEPSAPSIERVRELAELATLTVPISDVRITRLTGWTGGIKLALAVRGEVELAADLGGAHFEKVEHDQRRAILSLPKPRPKDPRLDHERTRILRIDRNGLWTWLPGPAGEPVLTDHAMRAAQRALAEAADDPQLVSRACAQTEKVLRGFFRALGWQVRFQWVEPKASEKAAS